MAWLGNIEHVKTHSLFKYRTGAGGMAALTQKRQNTDARCGTLFGGQVKCGGMILKSTGFLPVPVGWIAMDEVQASLLEKGLRWKGFEATRELAKYPNARRVVIGGCQDSRLIIPGQR